MPERCAFGSTGTCCRLMQGNFAVVRPCASRVEKRVHPHGFRHGWALGQVESGTSLPVIQQLLGHSSLATTATYVSHIAPAKAVAEATAKTAHLAVQP